MYSDEDLKIEQRFSSNVKFLFSLFLFLFLFLFYIMTWLLLLKHVQNSVCEALSPHTPEPIDTTISERIFNLIQEAYACVDHSVLPVCPSIHIHTRTASGETGAVANGLTNEIHIYVRKEAQRTGLYHTPFLRYVVYHEMGHIALRHAAPSIS